MMAIHLLFDIQRLLKVKAAYNLSQEGIKIIKEEEVSDIQNNQNKDRESDSEGSDANDGAAETGAVLKKIMIMKIVKS